MSNKKPIVMIAAVVAIAVIGFLIAGQQEKVAVQKDVKLGIIFGFTGPIESLTPPMAGAAELAMKEVTDSG